MSVAKILLSSFESLAAMPCCWNQLCPSWHAVTQESVFPDFRVMTLMQLLSQSTMISVRLLPLWEVIGQQPVISIDGWFFGSRRCALIGCCLVLGLFKLFVFLWIARVATAVLDVLLLFQLCQCSVVSC